MLDFRLETLLAVCQYMNYTKASLALNITQPAVSQHIKYLEDYYRIKIFQHIGKKIVLTKEGKQLYEMARTMKNDHVHFQKKLLEPETPEIRFGVTLSVGEYLMREPLNYLIEHKYDKISMSVANTQQLVERVDQGLLDFAIVEGYFNKREFDSLPFSMQNYVCVASYDYPYDQLSVDDLLKETIILREEGSGTREILERYLNEKNYHFDDFLHIIEIGNISLIKQLVLDRGVTFLYQATVEEELKNHTLKMITIDHFPLHHVISFIYRKNSVFKEDYQALYHLLKGE